MQQSRKRGDASPSREAIADAALAYLDSGQLESLSIRGLADRLGSFHANLYRRIASKDELLDLVAAAIFAAAGPVPRTGADPREELLDYGCRLRAAWLSHPNAYPLLLRGAHPAVMSAMDGVSGALFELGLPAERVVAGLRVFMSHVFGYVLVESLPLADPQPEPLPQPSMGDYPHLERLSTSVPPQDPATAATNNDELFRSALAHLLDGL